MNKTQRGTIPGIFVVMGSVIWHSWLPLIFL
jgi:hypothetical protein